LSNQTNVFIGKILLRQGVLDSTLWDKVCQLLAAVRWFSPGTPVSSNNKTDRHDISEILLQMALNTINTGWLRIRMITIKLLLKIRLYCVRGLVLMLC
jgi:hypothetical protein